MSQTSPKAAAEEFSSALLRLSRVPNETTPYQLWKALSEEERTTAAKAYWDSESNRSSLVEEIATTFNFRKETVREWEADKAAHYARHLRPHHPPLLRGLLVRLHIPPRHEMLERFLDQLGIPHRGGHLAEEADQVQVEEAQVRRAADRLREEFPFDQVVTYFLTLIALRQDFAPGLDRWLRVNVTDIHESTDAHEEDVSEEPVETEGGPARSDGFMAGEFTTLDRRMIRTVVDVAQGIEGAPTEDELDDLVGELIQLNSERHRSYFHAGFRDVVLGRPVPDEIPAQNQARLRWYWAGYLSGLGRKGEWGRIVELFDSEQAVRDAGRGSSGAGPMAAQLIFDALRRADRPGEAAAYLNAKTVVANPALLHVMRFVGTDLLREDRAAEARPLFDLLGDVVDRLEEIGVDTSAPLFLEILRRRAHCYRQLGESQRATELLNELLRRESDPGVRTMAETDLGLIDGGFRRLSDLVIPEDAERRQLLLESLEQGEPRFERAAEADVQYAAHGRFCLGVLELLRDNHEAAASDLDVALSVFESDPERYRHGNLLANTRLYLACAIAEDLQTGRNPKVAELVRKGHEGGGKLPRSMLSTVLAALALTSDELAQEVAESVLRAHGEALLDMLADSDAAARSEMITSALLERAEDEDRGETARVTDYRRVLPLLLEQKRHDEAARVLDQMEGAARQGIGRVEFEGLLRQPENYEPVWEQQDAFWARIQCLEADGTYQDALALLEEKFHEVLSTERFGYLEEAEALLEQMATYAPSEDRIVGLRPRLEAERESAEVGEPETADEPRRVRLLFVGGNETQEQYDADIRKELDDEGARIDVTFLHTGWSSNWGRHLETVKRELPTHDGLVLMRFMRTELGRQIRRVNDDLPWRGCYGTGKRAMKDSIKSAASRARRHLRRQERKVTDGGS